MKSRSGDIQAAEPAVKLQPPRFEGQEGRRRPGQASVQRAGDHRGAPEAAVRRQVHGKQVLDGQADVQGRLCYGVKGQLVAAPAIQNQFLRVEGY